MVSPRHEWSRFVLRPKTSLTEYLNPKKRFFLALLVLLTASVFVYSYIGMTATPIDSINISPASDSGWTFTLRDGTPITPDPTGEFPLDEPEETVYLSRSLVEHKRKLAASALLSINTRTCDVAVFAESELIADPTHRFSEADGSFAEA